MECFVLIKNVLITGGPSNEYIDEVMKITNMSSGKIAVQLSDAFLRGGYKVTAILNKSVKYRLYGDQYENPNLKIVYFETTEDLYNAIKKESTESNYDIVIHSAAVADYKPAYSFRMEDMAKEIANYMKANALKMNDEFAVGDTLERSIFNILTDPECKVNDDTKISSCEPNLTVKLGLTPKIIESLREWFPSAFICGFKLLENVPEEELIAAAVKQINKCKTDLVFANDLANLRAGNSSRLVINSGGFCDVRVNGAEGIYHLIDIVTK